ncbi:MAG: AAA family ATPase [Clostridia bacterium]|nr:AAA family ATPase [Clostridia bacterium]
MENSNKSKKQYEPKVKNVPNNEELEKSILSVIMNDQDAAQDIFARVNVSDFYSPRHQLIYKHLVERNRIGATFDFLGASSTMTEEVQSKIGGLQYLGEVNAYSFSSATYEQDVDLLKQLSTLRSVLKINNVVENRVYNNEKADDIVAYAQGELYSLKSANEKHELEIISEGAERVIADIQESYASGEKKACLSTGYDNLDQNANGGFLPGQMIVLAARPGAGKTAFAMNIVANIAEKTPEKVVAVFNLEMSRDELIKRLLATYSGVDSKLVSSGYNLTESQMNDLYEVVIKLMFCLYALNIDSKTFFLSCLDPV